MRAAFSTVPTASVTDREWLEAWRHGSTAVKLRPLLDRYGALVHSSAFRRTESADQAAEVTRAVFLVLARHAARLSKKTILAAWLFHVTAVACKKLRQKRIGRLRRGWPGVSRTPRHAVPTDAVLWTRVAPKIDRALDRISSRQRKAVLLCAFLNHDFAS